MTRSIAAVLLVLTAALAGCNTIAGAGQDISSGGNAISNTAEKAK
ncbi:MULTISPECIES: entericidin A/B family lipoprotein [Burkholderia]|jgi:entericidin B|nr:MULTISPECIES: entericidin A/B family lipoprotein [Burkholderia]ALK33274.1 Entericidin EcnAB [Burkholderia plantarii]MBI0330035.1 entericidin A/B family lipoprotein [Burkholderia plantarii]MBN3725176.1 entericidin A/B family lipoprotein [Burkholderia sp. Ac-20379]WLE62327.1 entericidin A/B family lipoprotein [Burkholderia plantarii]